MNEEEVRGLEHDSQVSAFDNCLWEFPSFSNSGVMGEDQGGGRKRKVSPGRVECGHAQEPAVRAELRVGPSLGRAPSPEPALVSPPRCTRKERCERSREPHRFASEMKQCVRLTVHPSNISVSQYNVLVRAA